MTGHETSAPGGSDYLQRSAWHALLMALIQAAGLGDERTTPAQGDQLRRIRGRLLDPAEQPGPELAVLAMADLLAVQAERLAAERARGDAAEARAAQAEARAAQAEARAAQAELRAAHQLAAAQQALAVLTDVTSSVSWRVTAPLRAVRGRR